MKNADMPAMPLAGDAYHDFSNYDGTSKTSYNPECQGLTKREMFAMNAPQCPEWFIDEFRARDDVELIYNPATGGHDKLSLKQRKRIWIEWRYAYADLMLED